MKTSFFAIALAALFVTAGFAQTEQESVSDAPATTEAVVTEVTPSTTVAPIATVPMTGSPVIMSSPVSSCGCSGVPMTMTSYVAPVVYQQPIVQQAQTIQASSAITPTAQTIVQPTQTFQSGYSTQPSYYGAGYSQPRPYSPGCGCSGGQSVISTPITQPIISSAAPITTQQPFSTVSAPISQPTIATPTIGQPIQNAQPVIGQTFPQTFSQPVGQTFQGSSFTGTTGNYWQPQSVYSNSCPNCCTNCNNNSNRFFNGRILRRR